jgi:hypothetical protein
MLLSKQNNFTRLISHLKYHFFIILRFDSLWLITHLEGCSLNQEFVKREIWMICFYRELSNIRATAFNVYVYPYIVR